MTQTADLHFDLTDSDARMAHMRAVKSLDLCLSLFRIREEVYRLRKAAETSSERVHALDEVLLAISNSMEDYDINLDHLIQ